MFVFWAVMPCGLVKGLQRFTGIACQVHAASQPGRPGVILNCSHRVVACRGHGCTSVLPYVCRDLSQSQFRHTLRIHCLELIMNEKR